MIVHIIEAVYHFLWGDLVTLHLSGTSIGIPLLVLLLIPTGIYFTFRTNFVSVRLFPDMVRSLIRKERKWQQLITVTDSFRIYRYPGWYGKSGGRSGCCFCRRRRCCVLDVAFRYFRLCHCFYRGNSGPDP